MIELAREHWDIALLAGVIFLLCGLVGALAFQQPEEPVARGTTGYGWLTEQQMVITGSGSAGSATGSKNSDGPIRGHIYAVHLNFASGISSTTDITLSLSSPSLTVMALTDTVTDTWYYPAVQQTNSAGTGTSTYDRVTVSGRLKAEVAESSSGSVVTATIWWGK